MLCFCRVGVGWIWGLVELFVVVVVGWLAVTRCCGVGDRHGIGVVVCG